MPSAASTQPPPSRSRGRLLSILGVGFGLAVAIGNTIAAGIARTPGEIATLLPSVWMFLGVWVAGGFYALVSANSLAELATMIPRSGGQFVYAQRALGPYPGFIIGWSDWLSNCGSIASVSIVIGEYAGELIPALAGWEVSLPGLHIGPAQTIALIVAVFFALLQWRGVRWGSRTQELTAVLKTLGFVALVIACFAFGGGLRGNAASPTAHAPSGWLLLAAVVISLQSVIYTYDGWHGVIYFAEEVRNPSRDIVRSIFGSVVSITAIYLLLNAALVYVLPMRDIAGQNFALGLATQRIFGALGDPIIRIVMVVSMLSGINAYHLLGSRVLFGMSRDGLFTRHIAVVNVGGTPTLALFASLAVAVAFIVTGTFEKVIAVNTFFFVANYTMSFISVFVLRKREPNAPRPYRAWGYPWTTALALLFSVAFLAGAVKGDTRNSVRALLLLGVSYPAYRLAKWLVRRSSS